MALELVALTHRYGRRVALDGVSLALRAGECYGLVGPNGAGKTTLLRHALLLAPTAHGGRVRVDGFDALAHPREALARVGGMIEEPALWDALDGRTHLELAARLAGMSRRAARARAGELLERFRVEEAASEPVRRWSQGMRQRLGIALALAGRARYLLLDEPTNALDPEGIADLRELLLGEVRERALGVLVSSHQLAEVEQWCDRVGFLRRGRLVLEVERAEIEQRAGGRVIVRTDDDVAAARVCAGLGLAHDRVSSGGLDVAAPNGGAPALARELVRAGLALHELAPKRASLEELYLRVARGGDVGLELAGANASMDASTSASGRWGGAIDAALAREARDTRERHARETDGSLAREDAPSGTLAATAHAPAATDERAALEDAPRERLAPPWPLARVVRHELARVRARPRALVWLLVPCVLAAAAILQERAAAGRALAEVDDGTLFSATTTTAFQGVATGLGAGLPALALILCAAASQALAGELGRGTHRLLLLQPLGRRAIVGGKLGALACAALAGAIALGATAFGLAAATADFGDVVEILPNGKPYPLVAASELWPALARALPPLALALAAAASLGFLVGALARGATAALAAALGVLVALDLARAPARALGLEAWLPTTHLPSPLGDRSALATFADLAQGISNASVAPLATALAVPLGWIAIALAVAWWRWTRRSFP